MHIIRRNGKRLAELAFALTLTAGLMSSTTAFAAGGKGAKPGPGPTVPGIGEEAFRNGQGAGGSAPRPTVVAPDGTIVDIIILGTSDRAQE